MRALFLVLVLVACGSAQPAATPEPVNNRETAPVAEPPAGEGGIRVVQRGAAGGVIEMEGDRTAAMAKAEQEMANVCGAGKYAITQEGEEVIANKDVTAWRVRYQCQR